MRIPCRQSTTKFGFVLAVLSILLLNQNLICTASARCQEDDLSSLSQEEAKQVKIAERFASILEKNPRRGTALERVYGHHVEYGTLDEYISGLRERVEKTPTDGTGWMILGLFEAHRGQDADAVDAFAQAEKNLPEDALPAYYMGQSMILIGQPENAVEAFERAITRKPRRADLLEIFQQLGRVHQRAQRTKEALDVWNRLEALFPDDVRVQEQIALTLVEEGEYGLALPRYEKLATQVKDDYRKVMFKIEAAELKIRENQRNEGVADYEAMLADLNPTSWLFRDVRHRIEEVFLRSGDQDGLVKYYERWIESHPEDVSGMARLAKFLASSARVPEASQWMEKALKLAPTRTELRKSFIDQLVDDQRYEEAVQQYAELVKSAPGNQDFLRDWGRLVMKNKKLDADTRKLEATKIWNRIVAARPDDALTNAQVADLYRQANLNDEAIELYKKAVELSPGDPQYREYLGEFYHILKRPEDAQATWSAIAEGDRHNAVNVARLAEVYNSFGYLDQAVEQIAEACRLEPKEFTLQSRAAEYHVRAGKFEDAISYIDVATSLAENDEQRDSALRGRIEVFQNSRKLDEEIDRLQTELDESQEATADQWHRLARYLEADRRWPEATEAVEEALSIDPKSILALTTSARIAELAGDFSRAAEVNRKLAEVDRRSRSEHLMNVARLEAQMGRSEEALSAGRELIVSAPGNTDNYEFYAQLCFQLGKNEEALDSLRKAVRINPTEPHLTMALGSALSKEFRTDEAIEVYWRAFEKSTEVDDKTALTEKLAGLYEQINQFDKLTERLERDQREESKRREMTICLAQAYQTSGDYGSARRELEGLLSNETRDTNLLQQLSKLCEASSDTDDAINYQRQLASIAPGHETEYRLAKLLQSRGDMDEASDILVKLTQREEDPVRLLRSLDSLMKQQSFESVIAVTEPLLSETRDNWELLYREAVAWASLKKIPEAKLRFERLLSLNFPHETLGIAAKEKLKRDRAKSRSDNLRGIQSQGPKRQSPLSMLSRSSQVQQATGMTQNYYSGNRTPTFWAPQVYGVARMAAFGWLMKFEETAMETASETTNTDQEVETENEVKIADKIADKVADLAADPDAERELIYDWMYVEQLRSNFKALFGIAKELAMEGGREEQQFFLNSLRTRSVDKNTTRSRSNQSQPKGTPLSSEEIELMMQCYESANKNDKSKNNAIGGGQIAYGSQGQMYVNVGGNWILINGGGLNGLSAVLNELKLAEQTERANELLSEKRDDALQTGEVGKINGILQILFLQERFDDLPGLYAKWAEAASEEIALAPNKAPSRRRGQASNKVHSANQLQSAIRFLNQWTGKLGAEEENQQVLEIMDKAFSLMVEEGKKRRVQQASRKRRSSSSSQRYRNSINTTYGKKQTRAEIDFPQTNIYVDDSGLTILRQTYEIFKRNDVLEDLPKHLRKRVAEAAEQNSDGLLFEQLMLGYVLWWMDEKEEAVELLTAASTQLTDDPSFRFEMAQLHEKMGDFDQALAIVESIQPRDQKLVQKRELQALQLAERLGDIDRARLAAERLFGLRLNTDTQIKLVQQTRRLGLLEMSEAVVSRLQRRSDNKVASMASLMTLYQGQGKTELTEQIANRILQRTKSPFAGANNSTRNPMRSSRSGDNALRMQALQVLKQTGALNKIISRVESQLERDPQSSRFFEQLIEYYEVAGNTKKVKELLDKAIKAKPDSMAFRYKLAKHYQTDGKPSEACDQYLVILKQKPRWVTEDFYQVRNVFKQAKRSLDLLKTIEKMDLKSFGQPWYLIDLVSNMLRNQNKEDKGIEQKIVIDLVERMFEAYPDYRNSLLSNLRDKSLWKNDRIYNLMKKGMVPDKNSSVGPWFGIGEISSYSGKGKVNGRFEQFLAAIKGTRKEKDFYKTVQESLVDHPDWIGGEVMLALMDLSGKRKKAGKKHLKEIFSDSKLLKDLPRSTGWLIAQELDKYEDTRELAVELLEVAVNAPNTNGMDEFQYSPEYRLVDLYSKVGREEEARKILIKESKRVFVDNYNAGRASYQKIENSKNIGDKLAQMGFHIDAVLVYRLVADDKQAFEESKRWGGRNSEKNILSGIEKSLDAAMNSKDSAAVINRLLSGSESSKSGESEIDLLISVPTVTTFREQSVKSQLLTLVEKFGDSEKGLTSLNNRVEKLKQENPNDLTTLLIDAFVNLKFSPEQATESIERLEKYFAENPLDEIAEGRRPNSRQRRQAMAASHVWLVAKECLKSEHYKEVGKRLAKIALTAAKRQIGNDQVVSILYDWGKADIDNENHEAAEEKWSEMLDYVTKRPTVKKPSQDASGMRKPPAAVPAMRAKTMVYRTMPRLGSRLAVVNRMKPVLVAYAQEVADQNETATDDSTEEKRSQRIPPLTLSQFRATLEIANAASENNMPKLSRRAVMKSLAGGLPVADPVFTDPNSSGRTVRSSSRDISDTDPIQTEVATSLLKILNAWTKQEDDSAKEVYELLCPLVFPTSRPAEIMMYEDSTGFSSGKMNSLGVKLVEWAAKAKTLEDLEKKIEQRQANDVAKIPAAVMKVHIQLSLKDLEKAHESMVELAELTNKSGIRSIVMLSCHAAIPAAEHPELEDEAAQILRKALQMQIDGADNNSVEPLGKIASIVNKYLAKQGDEKAIEDFFEQYMSRRQKQYARYSGDYGQYMIRQDLGKIANTAARTGVVNVAIDFLGRFEDANLTSSNYGRATDVSDAVLASTYAVRKKKAQDRYETWKTWTLPTEGRQSVRMFAQWDADGDSVVPAEFLGQKDAIEPNLNGFVSNFHELIDAAQESGNIEELKALAKSASDEKLANANFLYTLLLIQQDDFATAKPLIEDMIKTIKKRMEENRNRSSLIFWGNYLVCRACMKQSSEFANLYRQGGNALVELAKSRGQIEMVSRLGYDFALQKSNALESNIRPGTDAQLDFWFPISKASGGMKSWWVTDDDRLLHLAGPLQELLCFKYPLVGNFRFSFDAFNGTWAEGDSGYGGLILETQYWSAGQKTNVKSVSGHETVSGNPIEARNDNDYSRVTIESKDGEFKYWCNGSLVYREKLTGTSPWIMLRTEGTRKTAYKNFLMEGTPEIPQYVDLFAGDRMDGWDASFFTIVQPKRREVAEKEKKSRTKTSTGKDGAPASSSKKKRKYDWHVSDGVLHGRMIPNTKGKSQTYVFYKRPLLDGESFSYEFFYSPGSSIACPTIGRVAIMIDDDQINEHWITDRDRDEMLYEVEQDNLNTESKYATAENAGLKPEDWNSVSVTKRDGQIQIAVNGSSIYQRPTDTITDSNFGIFRYKHQTAEVRNAKTERRLAGDADGEKLRRCARVKARLFC